MLCGVWSKAWKCSAWMLDSPLATRARGPVLTEHPRQALLHLHVDRFTITRLPRVPVSTS